jgi:hypothetical protein
MRRRALIRWALSASATLPFRRVRARAEAAVLGPGAEATLRAVAAGVLPESLGARSDAIAARFLAWTRGYRAGAEMDHGYGRTRLRRTPPSPASSYATQLAALERAARERGASFAELAAPARRELIEAALRASGVESLPPRPDGRHVAADLMSFFFHGSEANDLCYGAAIGRDSCRGLEGSWEPPPPLAEGG